MNVNMQISLGQGEELAKTVPEIVTDVMAALGGDLEKDSISVQVTAGSYPIPIAPGPADPQAAPPTQRTIG